MILIPGVFTQFGKDRVSEIDNRKLVDMETAEGDNIFQKTDSFLEDRVGFREELITVNETVTDILFHKLVHPLYIYGREGHLFTEWDLENFQHMEPQEGYIDGFGGYLESIRDFCEDMGTQFIFFMPPNKESIYPEYYARGYNISDNKNLSELLTEKLDELGVNYVFSKDRFYELKQDEVLYNKIYDVGHWNYNGAYFACEELSEFLNGTDDRIKPIKRENYDITYHTEKYLKQSYEYKPETVPYYTYKYREAENDAADYYKQNIRVLHGTYNYHSRSEDEQDKPKILVLNDSFLEEFEAYKFFYGNYSELFMIHDMNSADIEYYISVIRPDIFVFECCERALDDSALFGAD